MEVRVLSNQNFSNSSYQNQNSAVRCDFCMYHDLIYDQLERLKEAIVMKNQRIRELENFIAKISQMAFMKTYFTNEPNESNNQTLKNVDQSSRYFQNQSSQNTEKISNSAYFQKKFEESSEISFQQSKINSSKFQVKGKERQPYLNNRLKKINELNEMKKQLKSQMSNAADSENHYLSSKIENSSSLQQFDTLRTLSQPQEEGRIGSMPESSCENSRLSEFSQRKTIHQDQADSEQTYHKLLNSQSKSVSDKNSISIIKEYIRKMQ